MKEQLNPLTQQPITNEQLQHISGLAIRQHEIEQRIKRGEKLLAELGEELRHLSQELLPDALDEVGMSSFELSSGAKVRVSPFYSGKILPETADKAFAWLREHGHGALIKRNITAKFGKGQDKEADHAIKLLESAGVKPDDKTSVHHQTLKAFIKEQVEAGNNLPTDLLGVFVGKVTKVTPAK